jgi:hypothetical protein
MSHPTNDKYIEDRIDFQNFLTELIMTEREIQNEPIEN